MWEVNWYSTSERNLAFCDTGEERVRCDPVISCLCTYHRVLFGASVYIQTTCALR